MKELFHKIRYWCFSLVVILFSITYKLYSYFIAFSFLVFPKSLNGKLDWKSLISTLQSPGQESWGQQHSMLRLFTCSSMEITSLIIVIKRLMNSSVLKKPFSSYSLKQFLFLCVIYAVDNCHLHTLLLLSNWFNFSCN